jgi:RNA polymerase primary sigma factor
MVNSDKLTDRQKKILKMRFVDDLTLEQIGAKFNLSKERIRSIEAKAVRQLRWPRHSDKLRVFIEG